MYSCVHVEKVASMETSTKTIPSPISLQHPKRNKGAEQTEVEGAVNGYERDVSKPLPISGPS